MFHVELRQFPHVARAFNLSEQELRAQIVDRWLRGDVVELGEQRWAPERARLKIYEGPELRPDEIAMGRGWANATRTGDDVTDRIVNAGAEPGDVAAALPAFKDEVLVQCAAGRIGIHQVLWLANEHHPDRRVSERVALAEQSVWELLHEGRLTMLKVVTDGSGAQGPAAELQPVPQQEWQSTLLAWATWADPRAPSVLLERL